MMRKTHRATSAWARVFVLTGSDHSYIVMGANARSGFFTALPLYAEYAEQEGKRAKD